MNTQDSGSLNHTREQQPVKDRPPPGHAIMSVRKTGRKHRILERLKRSQSFIDQEFQQRRDKESAPGKREEKKAKIAQFFFEHPEASARKAERTLGCHRITALKVREELGFVVQKKDYKCYKSKYEGQWPKQPGERPGICACGCGGATTRTVNLNAKLGMKPGDYYRFIAGHQWMLRRKLFKPKGWRSSHEILRERDDLRVKIALVAAKLPRYTNNKVATFEDLRGRMKKIELSGHNVVDQQVSRMLTIARYMPKVMSFKIPVLVKATTAIREEWRVRLCSLSLGLGAAPTFTDIRKAAGEQIPLPNQTISRFLNQARTNNPNIPVLTIDDYRRVYKPAPPPISEFFPYNRSNDLLEEVLSVIPEKFTAKRADLAHDIIEEVMSGSCKREELREKAPGMIVRFYRRHSFMGHSIVSLDAPMNEDGLTLLDVLDIKESITELNGGVNYETQQEYFNNANDFDGKVVAHY